MANHLGGGADNPKMLKHTSGDALTARIQRDAFANEHVMNYRQHQHEIERTLRAGEERRVFPVAPTDARAWARQVYNDRKLA
jgi:hypothetical protein